MNACREWHREWLGLKWHAHCRTWQDAVMQ